ncbi:hypothetical protein PC120_g18250, partial [Phytophthora cactorum]
METMAVNAVGRDMLLHASLLRALWGWIVQVDMREPTAFVVLNHKAAMASLICVRVCVCVGGGGTAAFYGQSYGSSDTLLLVGCVFAVVVVLLKTEAALHCESVLLPT